MYTDDTRSDSPVVSSRRDGSILVAEDDDEMRRLISDTLRDDGYSVAEVSSGNQLLHHLRTAALHGVPELPDLVISDVRMPGWSGLEVLAILSGLELKTPVVLVTAFGDLELRVQAAELGVRTVIDKPFDLDDLRGAVLDLLS